MTKDITGQRFGRLIALEYIGRRKRGIKKKYTVPIWKCQCDCGNICEIPLSQLTSGNTKSCGCIHAEQLRKRNQENALYPKEDRRIVRIWRAMIRRCENSDDSAYDVYGGRGISVCEEWHDFFVFRDWARANGYSDNKSIDRIDYNGNYCPENCRWCTQQEQCNNTRANKYLEYHGRTQTLSEWCRELNLNYFRTKARINYLHWTVEEAFEEGLYSQVNIARKKGQR